MSCSNGTEFLFCMKSPEDDGGGDCTTEQMYTMTLNYTTKNGQDDNLCDVYLATIKNTEK